MKTIKTLLISDLFFYRKSVIVYKGSAQHNGKLDYSEDEKSILVKQGKRVLMKFKMKDITSITICSTAIIHLKG